MAESPEANSGKLRFQLVFPAELKMQMTEMARAEATSLNALILKLCREYINEHTEDLADYQKFRGQLQTRRRQS